MQKYVLSVSAGLESIAKFEIKKQWWKIVEVVDRLITFEWDAEIAAKVALWSRVGNKVFMLIGEDDNIEDFDDLYGLVNVVEFEKYIPKSSPIIVKATSIRSELHHTPTIQSVSKKAIIDRLGGWSIEEDNEKPRFEILVLFINNTARIMFNIVWDALHKRGYRVEAWEAPIKESLAAGLVLLSGWKFKQNLYDPFCGSWTIAIEAALIARNIAPWLKRDFSMVDLGLISREKMWELKDEARAQKYTWEYRIFASDIDNEMIHIGFENARRAWVENDVFFERKDFRKASEGLIKEDIACSVITNPPYGLRLWEDDDLEGLYRSIDSLFRKTKNITGWFISNYEEFDDICQKDFYKKRKLYNWAEKCYFWKKK